MQYNEKESYYIELNPARFAVTTIGKVLVLIPLPIMPTINKKIFDTIPDDCYANPDLWAEDIGFVEVKSPKKTTNCCRNANHASKEQHACVCLTNHCFKNKVITEKQIEDRNRAIWISDDYHHEYIFWLIDGNLRKYKRP